jgi:hypothetical protein
VVLVLERVLATARSIRDWWKVIVGRPDRAFTGMPFATSNGREAFGSGLCLAKPFRRCGARGAHSSVATLAFGQIAREHHSNWMGKAWWEVVRLEQRAARCPRPNSDVAAGGLRRWKVAHAALLASPKAAYNARRLDSGTGPQLNAKVVMRTF